MWPACVFSTNIALVDVYLNNRFYFLVLAGGPLGTPAGGMIFLLPFLVVMDVIGMSMFGVAIL